MALSHDSVPLPGVFSVGGKWVELGDSAEGDRDEFEGSRPLPRPMRPLPACCDLPPGAGGQPRHVERELQLSMPHALHVHDMADDPT